MKPGIDIWSDVTCPFCYIGKHHLEAALDRSEYGSELEIRWRSFELNPNANRDTDRDIYDLLASKYGQTREWAVRANEDLKSRAAEIGLELHPEEIVPTNSFDAHRVIKLAGEQGLADEAKERLFAAYFSNGEHIGDHDILKQIGTEIGLDGQMVEHLLSGDRYADAVRADEREAQKIGIRGVPFFLFIGKHAVSGAQPVDVFVSALQKCREEQSNEVS